MPIYEQPLNERTRIFLRLEHLFILLREHMNPDDEFGLRSFVSRLLAISDLILRSDVKTEIIKELERLNKVMLPMKGVQQVDQKQLQKLLDEIQSLLSTLKEPNLSLAQAIKDNEFLNSIKQRETMPAGNCNFDSPNYHHWLNKQASIHSNDIKLWYSSIEIIDEAINLILELLRNSATIETCNAEEGFFQRNIDSNLPFQLIRVQLEDSAESYPEISAGKHRINIRMMQQENTITRPVQHKKDVKFKLYCCKI